jgi:hypothetical protein
MVCLVAPACQPPPSSTEVPPDLRSCPVAYFEEGISVPAVHLTMPSFFHFDAHVPLGPEGVQVDIDDAQGTVSFDDTGPMRAFVFNFGDWPDIGRRLFQGLAIKGGVWFPFWLYCAGDGTIDRFWVERTDQRGWKSFTVNGSWEQTSSLSAAVVDIPAMELGKVALTCGFDVTTPGDLDTRVNLSGSKPGNMAFPGYPSTMIFVFNTADCRTGCGARSWFELHSIMWNRERNEVGFQIWYLDPLVPGVLTDNTIVLPRVSSLNVAFPDATWQLPN